MSEIKSRIRKIEQRVAPKPSAGEIDWKALIADVAKNGKRLVDMDRDA